ncbi:unnamed protein product [Gadus morhua 'NCC']
MLNVLTRLPQDTLACTAAARRRGHPLSGLHKPAGDRRYGNSTHLTPLIIALGCGPHANYPPALCSRCQHAQTGDRRGEKTQRGFERQGEAG